MSKIYQPQGRAREYSPLAYNFFKGCTHGCKYCYVPRMLCRFNSGYDHGECVPNCNFAELEKSAREMQGCNKQILLSFTGDPYCGIGGDVTRRVLEILNFYGHKVAILTKGGKQCLDDIELFREFGERIKVGATLTFDNDKDSLEWEPGGALPSERVETLRTLAEQGIKTWASFEPVIIPVQSINLLNQVAPFIDHVKIGKLNDYKGIDKKIDWAGFIKDSVSVCRMHGTKFYIKKDLLAFNNGVFLYGRETDPDYLNL